MLRVKTYLDKSKTPGAGIGLFAAEDIPEGATIWRLDESFDLVIDQADWPPEVPNDFLRFYGYSPSGAGPYVVCLDNARFMNHSRMPNGIGDKETVAARDISAGEELTEDYRVLCHPSHLATMDFI
jgi:hypothetical protein